MTTRAQAVKDLEHALTNILEVGAQSRTREALVQNQIDDMSKFLGLSIDDAKSLQVAYTDKAGKRVTANLLLGQTVPITNLLAFARFRTATGQPIDKWEDVTGAMLRKYLITDHLLPAPDRKTMSDDEKALKDYEKSIKRDASAFPTLKDFRTWETYHRSFEIQMNAQGLGNIIDVTYNPKLVAEKALFKRQNEYVLGIFDNTLKADKAKEILRKHEKEAYPAQKIYAALVNHASTSTTASIEASRILS